MTRPALEAKESQRGFQTSTRRTSAARREHACLTFLMASGLTLATLIAVATVSMEVVTAATLY
jgi:hypothetical protein